MGGDLSWARTVLSEAIAAGDERTKAHALVQGAFLRLFTELEVTPRELIEVGEQAIDVFEQLSDELGLARAWRLIAEVQYLARRAGPSAEASEHALLHVRRVGDPLEETESVEWLANALLMGPTPVPEAIGRCERLLEEVDGRPALELFVTSFLANLLAMAGRLAEAQELVERVHRLRDERVGRIWFEPHEFGLVTRLADDPIAAERELQRGYEVEKRIGRTTYFTTIAALLARALYAQGRYEEADRLSRESEEAARSTDVYASMLWRHARAGACAEGRARGGRSARPRSRRVRGRKRLPRRPRRHADGSRGGARCCCSSAGRRHSPGTGDSPLRTEGQRRLGCKGALRTRGNHVVPGFSALFHHRVTHVAGDGL